MQLQKIPQKPGNKRTPQTHHSKSNTTLHKNS